MAMDRVLLRLLTPLIPASPDYSFMNSLLQAPTVRHLRPCSLFDILSSGPAPDSPEGYARPDLTHTWRFRDVELMNNRG
jgi:hypothetical protein